MYETAIGLSLLVIILVTWGMQWKQDNTLKRIENKLDLLEKLNESKRNTNDTNNT